MSSFLAIFSPQVAPTRAWLLTLFAVGLIAIWLLWQRHRRVGIVLRGGKGTLELSEVKSGLAPNELWFAESEDAPPAVQFYPMKARELVEIGCRRLEPATVQLDKLGPAIQAVASLLATGTLASGKYMRVI